MQLREVEAMLRERLAGTLPGAEAQVRFAPVPRSAAGAPGNSPRMRAWPRRCCGCIHTSNGVAIPLTVRATTLARHAGQVSLPGGAKDPGETLVEAALREASEEIGLDAASVRVLGELTPIHVLVSGFTLHPIVGVTDASPDFSRRQAKSTRSSRCGSRTCATPRASAPARAIAKA